MRNIEAKQLKPVLQSLIQPVIGICLGMQLLFESLEEGGETVHGAVNFTQSEAPKLARRYSRIFWI